MAVNDTIKDRGKVYGDFGHMSATIQSFKGVARISEGYKFMPPHQKEAVDMILVKLGRLITGDSNDRDSWHDIQGYAKLVEDRLPAQSGG